MEQKELLELPEIQQEEKKKITHCKFHLWNPVEHFIEITHRSGNKLKICGACYRNKLENRKIKQSDWNREKENISDFYVISMMRRGKSALKIHPEKIPKELIEASRATIQLKRLVDKLNEPLKKCGQHGDLFIDDVIKAGKNKSGDQLYKCRKCMKDLHAKNYALNKEIIKIKQKKYRDKDPGKYRAIKRKSAQKNAWKRHESCRERFDLWENRNRQKIIEAHRKSKIKAKNNLNDSFIRHELNRDKAFTGKDIPKELMELKRVTLMLKRSVKLKELSTKGESTYVETGSDQ